MLEFVRGSSRSSCAVGRRFNAKDHWREDRDEGGNFRDRTGHVVDIRGVQEHSSLCLVNLENILVQSVNTGTPLPTASDEHR